jgi:23S rRNA pseudouridine1911/1915/1917 synthase
MTQDRITITVTESEAGVRLDAFLAQRIPELSRSHVKKLIEEGHVTVGGNPAKASAKIALGRVIEVTIPDPEPSEVTAQNIPLTVLHEDSDIIVVNKPAHMVVHPAAGNPDGTLVNALLHHCKDLSGIGGKLRPGIVHRLDKGTSGVMVAAKNDSAHESLSRQFAEHSVEKEYRGIVLGKPPAVKGVWDEPIGRHPEHRKKMSTRSRHPRSALTRFKVIAQTTETAVLSLIIETGRTHQIRVHCTAAGCPVAHDETYGGIKRIKAVPDEKLRRLLDSLERPALHAYRLALTHPGTNMRMEFKAEIPDDMAAVIALIEANND